MRTATLTRKTSETDITLTVSLDGTGTSKIATGVGFFDHMLTLLARHALIDLTVSAKGDLHVDAHHTVEDVGIALGQALDKALADRRGITRYGHALLPMDEVLAQVALDFSGRPLLTAHLPFATPLIGEFPAELVVEFLRALATHAKLTLHVAILAPGNAHHMAEAAFKGLGRALRMAFSLDPREPGIPSTKGSL